MREPLSDPKHADLHHAHLAHHVLTARCKDRRERYLKRAVCRASDCKYRNNCVTYKPDRVPTPSELKHLGIALVHIGPGELTPWHSSPLPHILPDRPRPRTMPMHVTARPGLPGSLQYMQEGDVVL